MTYKVCKFGGSSLSSASGFIKVADIVCEDPDRRIVVVSAPGRRFDNDNKITDLLITFANQSFSGSNSSLILQEILGRFHQIIDELNLPHYHKNEIEQLILQRGILDKYEIYLDSIKSLGEEICAKIFYLYLSSRGKTASYVDPKDAGIILTEEPGNAQVIPSSFELISKLRHKKGIIVIPGFFGYSVEGKIIAFSRGGSDITGAIIASAVKADLYENFTDVDYVFAADPRIVQNPSPIQEITYTEMRELSYSGFNVFHDEALEPVFRSNIPVQIKNTNNPTGIGTLICHHRETKLKPIVGIAGSHGFVALLIGKYLMNREKGFGRKLLQLIEECDLSYEHCPSGIDNISVILRSIDLVGKEQLLIEKIQNDLQPDKLTIRRNISLIMIVGDGMVKSVGFANRVTSVCAEIGVNLLMINQGASENSIMLGVDENDRDILIQKLHDEFFGIIAQSPS